MTEFHEGNCKYEWIKICFILSPIGDKHAHWQSLEGLGAIAFNRGQTDRAVLYFKQALSLVAATEKDGTAAQERIVGKLTDALQYQVTLNAKSTGPSGGAWELDSRNMRPPSVSQNASLDLSAFFSVISLPF